MGLTIYYRLQSDLGDPGEVRDLVEAMRQHARQLPFKRVGKLLEFEGPEADADHLGREDPHFFFKITACQYLQQGERHHSVAPLHTIGFSTYPGDGSETANFGLCKYPARIPASASSKAKRPRTIPTHLDKWCWSSFCKTQYASNPKYGGIENFIRCHLSIIKLLDFAVKTGFVQVECSDEGGYWKERDLDELARKLHDYNRLVAAVVGGLSDQLSNQDATKDAVSYTPIKQFPDFEHLEAKGLADLERRRKKRRGK